MKKGSLTEEQRARQNASWRKWYAANGRRKLSWQLRLRGEMRAWVFAMKGGLGCQTCGESHPACLQFHHRDPATKDFDIANAIANGWSKVRLQREIAKCDVLCANCHARLHARSHRNGA